FGRRPDGLWPGEGAVSQEIISTVEAGGFSWMASDDQLLQKSLGGSPLGARQKYQMYWAVEGDARVAMIFRDHGLSDEIGFNFSKMDGVAAANSMMRSLHGIHKALALDDRDYIVPIILDGENAWDWYRHDGKEFFHSWYQQMSEAGWLRTVTVAEYLEEHPPTATIQQLWAGSWISSDFSTWIGEDEENKAWDYLTTVRDYLAEKDESGTVDADLLARAYDEIYAAEGSDWFWWYGTDQDSANDGAFDEIFRGTLKNVYEILGDEPPALLSRAISAAGGVGGGGVMARAATAGDAELLVGPVLLDEGILFSIRQMSADRVNVAGEFNGWSTDATPMSDEDGDGIWIAIMELEPGSYEYKFVTDGGASWIADEGNPESVPDPYGGKNSLVIVE
ncbi:hypothetical protein KAW64_12520, partial [bacterium]|nr:hypothetical protein [bacterium]